MSLRYACFTTEACKNSGLGTTVFKCQVIGISNFLGCQIKGILLYLSLDMLDILGASHQFNKITRYFFEYDRESFSNISVCMMTDNKGIIILVYSSQTVTVILLMKTM
jgi:hypothetical protein